VAQKKKAKLCNIWSLMKRKVLLLFLEACELILF
jgi:hypothetical protein